MANIRYITLTGVDENTPLQRLEELSKQYPHVEWGVLYSPSRAGAGRYPSLAWIRALGARLCAEELSGRYALHLCGKAVTELLEAPTSSAANIADGFNRVQLNLNGAMLLKKGYKADQFVQLILNLNRRVRSRKVILQLNSSNEALISMLRPYGLARTTDLLFDASGGRGVLPSAWPELDNRRAGEYGGMRMGFAGGLGPDNILEHLPKLLSAAGEQSFWIDMEGRLRDEQDRFCLTKAVAVLEAAAPILSGHAAARGAYLGEGEMEVGALTGFWLQWWAGRCAGYNMVIPPEGAIHPMALSRATGDYFSPEQHQDVLRLMDQEDIGLVPVETSKGRNWKALVIDDGTVVEAVFGTTPVEAALRAIVTKRFGASVPRNPALVN